MKSMKNMKSTMKSMKTNKSNQKDEKVWHWKVKNFLSDKKSTQNKIFKIKDGWCKMGPVAAERCEKVLKKGKPGDTHYVTLAPMLSYKLTLLNKNRMGLVYSRASKPDADERFLARKMIYEKKKQTKIPDYMRPKMTNELTRPTQDMIDHWEQSKMGTKGKNNKEMDVKKGSPGEKKDKKNNVKKPFKAAVVKKVMEKVVEKHITKGKEQGVKATKSKQ